MGTRKSYRIKDIPSDIMKIIITDMLLSDLYEMYGYKWEKVSRQDEKDLYHKITKMIDRL